MIMFEYEFPMPSITADIVLFKYDDKLRQYVLLIERGEDPYKGGWALPGGFMNLDESVEECAYRELLEETGLVAPLKLIGLFDTPNRDPRGRVVTVAYSGILRSTKEPIAGDDAAACRWFPADELPFIAFDHNKIINKAKEMLNV